jgi:hypothetical protein
LKFRTKNEPPSFIFSNASLFSTRTSLLNSLEQTAVVFGRQNTELPGATNTHSRATHLEYWWNKHMTQTSSTYAVGLRSNNIFRQQNHSRRIGVSVCVCVCVRACVRV